MTHIYEVIDATDDERYYTLGLFLTEAEALSVLDSEEPPSDENGSDAVTLEVRRRPLGYHPHAWTKVAERTWVRNYDDNLPDWTAGAIQSPSYPLTLNPTNTPI